jgi:hypothetical protein
VGRRIAGLWNARGHRNCTPWRYVRFYAQAEFSVTCHIAFIRIWDRWHFRPQSAALSRRTRVPLEEVFPLLYLVDWSLHQRSFSSTTLHCAKVYSQPPAWSSKLSICDRVQVIYVDFVTTDQMTLVIDSSPANLFTATLKAANTSSVLALRTLVAPGVHIALVLLSISAQDQFV